MNLHGKDNLLKKRSNKIFKKISCYIIFSTLFYNSVTLWAMDPAPDSDPPLKVPRLHRSNRIKKDITSNLSSGDQPSESSESPEPRLLRSLSTGKPLGSSKINQVSEASECIDARRLRRFSTGTTLKYSIIEGSPQPFKTSVLELPQRLNTETPIILSSIDLLPESSKRCGPQDLPKSKSSRSHSTKTFLKRGSSSPRGRGIKKALNREDSTSSTSSASLTRTQTTSDETESPILENNISETPLLSPAPKAKDKAQDYMKSLLYLFKKNKPPEHVGQLLAETYPLFIKEKYLFGELNKIKQNYPKHIKSFLKALASQGFQSTEEEFTELKKELPNYPTLSMQFINHRPAKSTKMTNKGTSIKKLWIITANQLKLTTEDFVRQLLIRDVNLFQELTLADLENTQAITAISHAYNQTHLWVALQIISASSREDREELFYTFHSIANQLIKQYYFHSAMPIVLGLTKPLVERLINIDKQNKKTESKTNTKIDKYVLIKMLENNKHSINISDFANPLMNHKCYRNLLNECPPDAPCLPVFPVILKDLTNLMQVHQDTNDLKSKGNLLEPIAKTVKPFINAQRIKIPQVTPTYVTLLSALDGDERTQTNQTLQATPPYNEILSNLDIHEDTLGILSEMAAPQKNITEHTFPCDTSELLPLHNWTPLYLASLLNNTGNKKHIQTIFEFGIQEGQHLISYMSNLNEQENRGRLKNELHLNKTMIDTIMEAYRLFLPPPSPSQETGPPQL